MTDDFMNRPEPTHAEREGRTSAVSRPRGLKDPGALVSPAAGRMTQDQARENLRSLISGCALVSDVLEAATILADGVEAFRAAGGEEVQLPLDRVRIASLKASADLKMKLLNKVLPDLASVQLGNGPGEGLVIQLVGKEAEV